MKHLWTICVFLLSFYNTTTAKKVDGPLFQKPSNQLQRRNATIDKYIHQLRSLFVEILRNTKVEQCLAVITDDVHQSIYEKKFYDQRDPHLSLYLKLNNSEDMLSPNYQTVKVLKTIRMLKCDMFFITVLNGVQVKRFLIFTEKHRLLNTQEKMVFLYDKRILTTEMAYIWSTIVRNVFVKREWSPGKFSLLAVPYPNVLSGLIVTQHLTYWEVNKSLKRTKLFQDQASNFQSTYLPTVVFEHVPMVQRENESGIYHGIEVEIIKALGSAMNFKPSFYESNDSKTEQRGKFLPNGSYTGLIGQIINRKALLAIGDLQFNTLYTTVMDMSEFHNIECFTFLTAESSQDNTWKTLISPFKGGMWAGVLLSLFMVGTIFYLISWIHATSLGERNENSELKSSQFFLIFRKKPLNSKKDKERCLDVKFRSFLNRPNDSLDKTSKKDIFDDFSNCILLTYSMLLYVSLPKMPRNWPLRVLTGWYWMYCILLAVTYRASFTAILANPSARITIDTIDELARSSTIALILGNENKNFFDEAFDAAAQKIGSTMELTDDVYGVTDLIAKGNYVYYDNEYFLRHLRVLGNAKRSNKKELHIMRDCAVTLPIAIGMPRNSPLKPHINKYLVRMKESGLITKWLHDAVANLPGEEEPPQEALMDFSKFWSSLVALSIGYLISSIVAAAEILHFKYFVEKHPLYDKYNTRIYYNFIKQFPDG